jgi:hypothetical protein
VVLRGGDGNARAVLLPQVLPAAPEIPDPVEVANVRETESDDNDSDIVIADPDPVEAFIEETLCSIS